MTLVDARLFSLFTIPFLGLRLDAKTVTVELKHIIVKLRELCSHYEPRFQEPESLVCYPDQTLVIGKCYEEERYRCGSLFMCQVFQVLTKCTSANEMYFTTK